MQRQIPQTIKRERSLSLRALLILFGLCIAVPILLIGGWTVAQYSRAESDAARLTARWHARELSKSIEHELKRAADQIATLASSRALADGELDRLYKRVSHAAEIFKTTILVRDATGQQMINTRMPFGTPLPTSQLPQEARDDLAAGRMHISNVYVGVSAKRNVVTVSVPIKQNGIVTHSISMGFEPTKLFSRVNFVPKRDDWTATIVDRNGVLIAATHGGSDQDPQGAPAVVPPAKARSAEGTAKVTLADGSRVLRAYHRSEVSGWTTAIDMPFHGLDGPFAVRWQTLASAGFLLLAFTSALAYVMANSLIRQFRGLAQQATSLVMGTPLPPSPSRLREANEVTRSLHVASRQLSARNDAVRHSEAQLRAVLDGVPIGMFRTDLDKNVIYANPRLSEMANASLDTMNGRRWLQELPPASRAKLETDWDADIADHGYFEGEITALSVRRGLGTIHIQFHAIPERDPDGMVIGYIGTVTDITQRKRAEQALTAEMDRFRNLTLASPDAVFLHDATSHEITFLNQRLHHVLGLADTEKPTIGAATFYDLIASDDLDAYQRHIGAMRSAEDGNVQEIEFRVRRSGDNSPAWILTRTVVFKRHPDGRVNQILCIASDITSRKQADALLEGERDRFKRMALASPDVVFLFDLQQSSWTHLNRPMSSVLGYGIGAGEASGTGPAMFELLHPDDYQVLREHVGRMRLVGDGEADQIEFRARHIDGTYRWFLNRSVVFDRGADGIARQILGIATDITTRKQAEAMLAEENDRFKRIALASPDLVYLYDRQDRKISFMNRPLREALGYEPDGRAPRGGEEMYELIFAEDLDGAHRHIKSIAEIDDGKFEEYVCRFVGPNRMTRWLRNRAAVFSRHADGRVSQILGIVTDITESKLSSEASARSNAELEARVVVEVARREQAQQELARAQSLEAIGRLTGGVAHDFANMLTVVMTSLQLFKKAQAGQGSLDLIDDALAGAETGRRLTQQLLSFARRQPVAPIPINLSEHLGSIVRWIRNTLGEDIDVRTTFAKDLGDVLLDESGLDSSIINLIMNARDAMPEGGALLIDTGNIYLASCPENGVTAGDYVFLAITDTGAGMTADVMQRAFDPFFTTKGSDGGGSGLGLSSVYGFVKQSRGRVEIRSALGHGTSIVLYFPRCTAKLDPRTLAADADTVITGTGQLVLVVEDMPKLRELFARTLTEAGYRTLTAENGIEAKTVIEAALAHGPKIDAVLSDIRMPGGVSGRDLARWVEKQAPGVAVVLMTAYEDGRQTNPSTADTSAQRHVARLSKPFTTAQLTQALHEAWKGPASS